MPPEVTTPPLDPPCNPVAEHAEEDMADAVDRINAALRASEAIGGSLEARVGERQGTLSMLPVIELIDWMGEGDTVVTRWYTARDAELEFVGEVRVWMQDQVLKVLEAF